MLGAADIFVDGQQLVDDLGIERLFRVVRVRIAQIIPARADEGVQRIRIAQRVAAAVRALGVHELLALGERGFAVRFEFHVVGEPDGQIFDGYGNDAALGAMHDGDGRAPVALAGNEPVAQAVIDFALPLADLGEVVGDLRARFFAEAAVKLQAVYADAVFREREHRLAVLVFDDLGDGQAVFFREGEVALVVRGHAHDRARAVRIEDVIGGVDGHFFAVDGVDGIMSDKDARLFARGGEPLDLVGVRRLFDVFFDGGALLVGGELFHERVFGREHDVGHAVDGVAAGRKDLEGVAALTGKFDLAADGLADPVFLHELGLFRPIEFIQSVQQFFRIIGDLEEPLR